MGLALTSKMVANKTQTKTWNVLCFGDCVLLLFMELCNHHVNKTGISLLKDHMRRGPVMKTNLWSQLRTRKETTEDKLRLLWIQRTIQVSPAQIAHLHNWEITTCLLLQLLWGRAVSYSAKANWFSNSKVLSENSFTWISDWFPRPKRFLPWKGIWYKLHQHPCTSCECIQ